MTKTYGGLVEQVYVFFGLNREWDDWDVQYVKLPKLIENDEDEDAIPSAEFVQNFFDAVQKHKEGDNRDSNIAVFCGKGFNHTGFLIAWYYII